MKGNEIKYFLIKLRKNKVWGSSALKLAAFRSLHLKLAALRSLRESLLLHARARRHIRDRRGRDRRAVRSP